MSRTNGLLMLWSLDESLMKNLVFRVVSLMSFLCTICLSYGQTCAGSLGENIFRGGDFGSGATNVLVPDPRIAPGYQYSLSNPPGDGYYVITNNTNWPGLYGTWLSMKDNSNDPNGYMMVVNASYTPGIFYEQTITGLCENTLYEFSADIINLIKTPVTGHILPNVSFLLDSLIKYNTGAIPQSERWNKVGFTFTTATGQDTLRLALQNNAPGGNGNDLAIDNISFRACGPRALITPDMILNICEDNMLKARLLGTPYPNPAIQWQRSVDGVINWTNFSTDSVIMLNNLNTGIYYYRYLIAGSPQNLLNPNCRVISNVKLYRVQARTFTITDTICGGLTYRLGNKTYTRSGIYNDSLRSASGCDSIVTLQLTVLPDLFSVDLGEDKMINLGESILLRAQSNVTALSSRYFFDHTSICENNCENLSWMPPGTGKVSVRAISPSGCVATDSILVTVNEIVKVYVPNVFTPNDDGQNDYFMIHGDPSYIKAISSLQVYDRYGGLIFDRQDLLPNEMNLGWDGMIKGKRAIPGNYVYQAKLLLINGHAYIKSGGILLLR